MATAGQQLIVPNQNVPYYGGECENYVERTSGQGTLTQKNGVWVTTGVFPTAHAAWLAHPDHPGEQPPSGLMVALHFTLGSTVDGHTALSLGDGRIASSTQSGYHTGPYIHPSLQDLITIYAKANNGCTYLGWSEWIGKKQVVEGENMNATKEQLIVIYELAVPNQSVNMNWVAAFTGKSIDDALNNLVADPSRQKYITQLVNDAAAYEQGGSSATQLKPGNYTVK